MRAIAFVLLMLLLRSSLANTISVGDTTLDIPSPDGFVAVTPQMEPVYSLLQRFVAPINIEFVSFVSAEDAALALRNEIPGLSRRFSVQTARSLQQQRVTSANFAELKALIKSQNQQIAEQTRTAINEAMGEINDDLAEQYDVDLALSISQIVPMPVHEESERSLAYSAYVKTSVNDEAGNAVPIVTTMTLSFIHVRARVLFLYSYAEESGLEWSQVASGRWSNAIVNANPLTAQSSIDENLPAAPAGIDWRQVGITAIAGAFIGLIVALLGWIFRRNKTS